MEKWNSRTFQDYANPGHHNYAVSLKIQRAD